MKNRPDRNLYKEAFVNQYNLILLGFAGAASLVTLSPIPLLAAGGLELLYLGFVAETDFFQRYVDNKYLALDMEEARERMEERLKLLDSGQRRRYEQITKLIEEFGALVSVEFAIGFRGLDHRARNAFALQLLYDGNTTARSGSTTIVNPFSGKHLIVNITLLFESFNRMVISVRIPALGGEMSVHLQGTPVARS